MLICLCVLGRCWFHSQGWHQSPADRRKMLSFKQFWNNSWHKISKKRCVCGGVEVGGLPMGLSVLKVSVQMPQPQGLTHSRRFPSQDRWQSRQSIEHISADPLQLHTFTSCWKGRGRREESLGDCKDNKFTILFWDPFHLNSSKQSDVQEIRQMRPDFC